MDAAADREEPTVDDVLQCPHCDLKFASRADLNQHLAFDHPEHSRDDAAG